MAGEASSVTGPTRLLPLGRAEPEGRVRGLAAVERVQPEVAALTGVLPRLSLFQVAEATPAVILNGRIHYLAPAAVGAAPCLHFGDLCFGLEPAQTLRE